MSKETHSPVKSLSNTNDKDKLKDLFISQEKQKSNPKNLDDVRTN